MRLLRELAIGAHRKHVAEGRFELELDGDIDLVRVRVQDTDAFAQPIREEPRPSDGKRVRGMTSQAEDRSAGVHELERGDVVLLGVRRQQDRTLAVDAHRVARQVLGVVVIEPERARGAEGQAAVVLGDEDEGVLLERDRHARDGSLADQRSTSDGLNRSKASACASTWRSAPAESSSLTSSMSAATRAK